MKTRILQIFTRTPLHLGAGSSVGSIDQPVQRERHTGFPIIPGSSIKGVMREHFRGLLGEANGEVDQVFGWSPREGGEDEGRAGAIAFSEARLLAFPLRSARGSFAMATSPLALQRFARDAGLDLDIPPEPTDQACLAGSKVMINKGSESAVVLEEYAFAMEGEFPEAWADYLSGLLNDAVLSGARHRWVLLSNGNLSHFAINACQVNQHVRINHETGTVDGSGLFNEETVPSETLFYSLLTDLGFDAPKDRIYATFKEEQLMQFGGNNTTGLGFCTVKLHEPQS